MSAPGRFSALKLLARETNKSVMLFEVAPSWNRFLGEVWANERG